MHETVREHPKRPVTYPVPLLGPSEKRHRQLSHPDETLDDRFAIVGTSSSGKTYAMMTAVERLPAAPCSIDGSICFPRNLDARVGFAEFAARRPCAARFRSGLRSTPGSPERSHPTLRYRTRNRLPCMKAINSPERASVSR